MWLYIKNYCAARKKSCHFFGKFLIALELGLQTGAREREKRKRRGKDRRRKRNRREKDYFPQPLSPAVPKPRHSDHHIRFKAMHQLTITYC
jgi:hypothetical protein